VLKSEKFATTTTTWPEPSRPRCQANEECVQMVWRSYSVRCSRDRNAACSEPGGHCDLLPYDVRAGWEALFAAAASLAPPRPLTAAECWRYPHIATLTDVLGTRNACRCRKLCHVCDLGVFVYQAAEPVPPPHPDTCVLPWYMRASGGRVLPHEAGGYCNGRRTRSGPAAGAVFQ